MKEKLEILLVEDDSVACKDLISIIDETENMTLVGVTNNSAQALEYINDFLPDVIILDLELHQGCGSGLDVLTEIKGMKLGKKPYVLVTTNNSSLVTYDIARNLGADYIISKHQINYSAKSVIDFLQILSPTLLSRRTTCKNESVLETPLSNQKRTVRRITTELNHVGVNPKDVGYQYLIDAIQITMEQRTPNISKVIAQRYNKTEASVIRAMQTAIERAWKNSNIDDLFQHYTATINSEKGVPTTTEFVCYYANKLNSEY